MPLSKHGVELSLGDLPGEVWELIDGYDNHFISNKGRIKSTTRKTPIIMSGGLVGGYPSITLWSNGVLKSYYVHQLVANAFIGIQPDGYEINHIDLNKKNNAVDNLEYITPQENVAHAINNGFGASIVTPEKLNQLLAICDERKNMTTVYELHRLTGISQNVIKSILSGTHPFYEVEPRKLIRPIGNGYKLKQSHVQEIRQLLSLGELTQAAIARMYDVDASVITRIKQGTYYHSTTIDKGTLYITRKETT